jgi:hypothetical protein
VWLQWWRWSRDASEEVEGEERWIETVRGGGFWKMGGVVTYFGAINYVTEVS